MTLIDCFSDEAGRWSRCVKVTRKKEGAEQNKIHVLQRSSDHHHMQTASSKPRCSTQNLETRHQEHLAALRIAKGQHHYSYFCCSLHSLALPLPATSHLYPDSQHHDSASTLLYLSPNFRSNTLNQSVLDEPARVSLVILG